MIGTTIRTLIIFFTSVVLVYLLALPDHYEMPADDEFNLMPDADFAAIAEHHWNSGHRESAISVLEYARETAAEDRRRGINDTGMVQSQALCRQLLHEYTSVLADEASIDGRLWKAGSGAITGEIDSWESMAGSTVADLFVVGDIRDIIMQSFIVDETDELILALSAVGLLTTAWPPADPAVSMIKAARKSKSISEPVTNQLIKTAKQFKNAPGPKTQEAFLNAIKPVWEMGGKCASWSQFKLMLKHSDSVDQIRSLNKIMAHSPKTARQVNNMFAVCSTGGKQFKNLFKILNKSGQKSCDAIYTVIRKGPPGIRWLAKNPKLVTRVIKIGYKDTKWGYNEALKRYGRSVLLARYLGIIICIAIIMACSPLRRLFRRGKVTDESSPGKTWRWKRIGAVTISAVLLAAVITAFYKPPEAAIVQEEAKNPYTRAMQCVREIRVHLQEDDDLDPNDHFQRQIIVPVIRADDGSLWLICSREDLGIEWDEINDGDISMISYISSRRGPDPASADTPEHIYFYQRYPRLCLIPCPPSLATELAQPPLRHEELQDLPPLYYMPAANDVRGISVTHYSNSKNGFAADIKRSDQKPVRFGDFLMDGNGRLAGFFTSHRGLLRINPDFRKHLVQIVRPRVVNNSGYHQQFVEDIKALP